MAEGRGWRVGFNALTGAEGLVESAPWIAAPTKTAGLARELDSERATLHL